MGKYLKGQGGVKKERDFVAERVKAIPPWPIDTGATGQRHPPVDADALAVWQASRTPIEWSGKSKYNPFNSFKGLAYYDHYRAIVGWLNGNDYLPPPIEVNLDPVMGCNLNCYFCITQRYMKGVKHKQLPLDYMLELVDFLVDWGVKGLCISGGGEPTLHKGLGDLIAYASWKMDVAVVTNATNLIEELLDCRWVALSVDAATRDTYKAIKGKDMFNKVCDNIGELARFRKETGSETDLCFKFLIIPENQGEIYDACVLAKELGVRDFHTRPVDFERKDIEGAKPLEMDIQAIHKQFNKCHAEETDDFRVFTVMHKFDSQFHVKYDYKSCLAPPLILPILTDGNAYICVEHKMEKKYRLGSCYPEPDEILGWWGSDEHRQMIKSVIPKRDCSRCIYSEYNKQIEEVVVKDGMCLAFP